MTRESSERDRRADDLLQLVVLWPLAQVLRQKLSV
jgi:hypothetical protein